MLQLNYASAAYLSPTQLIDSVPLLLRFPNYALAKASAVEAPPLYLPVTLKFAPAEFMGHLVNEGPIDGLAQIEFTDIEDRQRLEPVRESFYAANLGRISLVPRGAMQTNLSRQLDVLVQAAGISKELADADLSRIDPEFIKPLANALYNYLIELGEMRVQSGFSAFENRLYGGMIYILNQAYSAYHLKSQPSYREQVMNTYLRNLSSLLRFTVVKEMEKTGPNQPVDLERLMLGELR